MSCRLTTLLLAVGSASPAHAAGDPVPDGMERRHQVGFQAGGSSVFQLDYRYRLAGPVHLDVGLLALPGPGPMNASLGLVVVVPTATRLFPYVGAGVGFAVITENRGGSACGEPMPGCPSSGDDLAYVYARAGVGLALDAARRHTLGLDLGAWWGRHGSTSSDGAGHETSSSRPILWPMAGASCFFAFH
jgi:hypothetical protein